jgi:predicted metal-binding membrane protein
LARGERAFFATCALLFLASVAAVVHGCRAMGMSGSMAMPDATGLSQAGSFMGQWTVMMFAMMLPSLAPALAGYRRRLDESRGLHGNAFAAVAGGGYFLVWAVPGALGYGVGLALASAAGRWPALSRALPFAAATGLLLAGCFQLSAWKARQLGRCRSAPGGGPDPPPRVRSAWGHGVRLGVHCVLCCLGYTVALFAVGVMDLGAMALVTAAITVERLVPRPRAAALAAGILLLAAGGVAIARVAYP